MLAVLKEFGQIQYLLRRWKTFEVRADSCTSERLICFFQLHGLSGSNGGEIGDRTEWVYNHTSGRESHLFITSLITILLSKSSFSLTSGRKPRAL